MAEQFQFLVAITLPSCRRREEGYVIATNKFQVLVIKSSEWGFVSAICGNIVIIVFYIGN